MPCSPVGRLERGYLAEGIGVTIIAQIPNDFRSWISRGAIYSEMGQRARARADQMHAAQIDPDNPDLIAEARAIEKHEKRCEADILPDSPYSGARLPSLPSNEPLTNRKPDRIFLPRHQSTRCLADALRYQKVRRAMAMAMPLRECARKLSGMTFVAPVLADRFAQLRRFGHTFGLTIAGSEIGWRICRVSDLWHAEISGEAEPWERNDYLARFRTRRFVLVAPAPHASWLALPQDGTLLLHDPFRHLTIVHLVEGGTPFAQVHVRCAGGTLLFDAFDRQSDPQIAEDLFEAIDADLEAPHIDVVPSMVAAYALVRRERITLTSGQGETLWETFMAALDAERKAQFREWRREMAKAQTFEKRLRRALTLANAQLIEVVQAPRGFRVTWTRNGVRNVTLVDEDLTVVHAGFCLSGQDRRFDLASIVDIALARPRPAWEGVA